MQNFKIKSYCKINLFLRVIKKLSNGYHSIASLVTFCKLHDLISISEIKYPKDKITFSGNFKNGINNKINTITKVLSLLRKNNLIKNKYFKINIKKNIPHGSGLGGGSSNAADLLKFFNKKLILTDEKLKKFAKQVGFDVPISLEKENTLLIGKKDKFFKIKRRFKFDILIVYPNIICKTKKIFKKNRVSNFSKKYSFSIIRDKKKLINLLISENNDLEETVIKIYPKVGKIINFIKCQKGCYLSRITGSGSACIGIFSSKKNAILAQNIIRSKYPKYWCVVSKTI